MLESMPHCRTLMLSAVLAVLPAALAAATVETASPGAADRFALVDSGCSTFSWAAVAGAQRHELLVFEVVPGALAGEKPALGAEPALRVFLAGGVTSWTPGREQCLGAGRSYVWTVRSIRGDGPAVESPPRLFAVAVASGLGAGDAPDGGSRTAGAPERPVEREAAGGAAPAVAAPSAAAVTAPSTVALANEIHVVDGTGDVGLYTSMTIGSDGLPLIAYYARTGANLKVAHCLDVACQTSTRTILDSPGDVGLWPAVTVAADGLGLISYYDKSSGDLKVAHCTNAACTSATLSTVDSAGVVGEYTSITVATDGFGLISYYDRTGGNLKVAHCTNATCSAATKTTLDSVGNVGEYTAITILGSTFQTGVKPGFALIVYYDVTNSQLKSAKCLDATCTTALVAPAGFTPGNVGRHGSVTTLVDGFALAFFRDLGQGHLVGNYLGPTGNVGVIDDDGNVGYETSVTVGGDGIPLVSYYDVGNADLKLLRCADSRCGEKGGVVVLDSGGDVGRYSSLTIGADGLPVVAYYDSTNGDLKVVHCGSVYCVPYLRRR